MDADSMAAYENFLQDQTEETAFNVAARALERLSIDEDLVVSLFSKENKWIEQTLKRKNSLCFRVLNERICQFDWV